MFGDSPRLQYTYTIKKKDLKSRPSDKHSTMVLQLLFCTAVPGITTSLGCILYRLAVRSVIF